MLMSRAPSGEGVDAGLAVVAGAGVAQPQEMLNAVESRSPQSQSVTSEGWMVDAFAPELSWQCRTLTSSEFRR